MALVRCPTHKIPYNDENPRGCPACHRETGRSGRPSVMQGLAQAQLTAKTKDHEAQPPASRPTQRQVSRPPQRQASRNPFAQPLPVTSPPRSPDIVERPVDKVWRLASQRRLLAVGGTSIVVMIAVLILTSGPRFVAGQFPARLNAPPRPLPINPNTPITFAFGALGSRAPTSNPDSPRLMRYTYGSNLAVDAANSIVYSLTIRIPNRSWGGLSVGMLERNAIGALARLGVPQHDESSPPQPETIGNYRVYRSLDGRPRRVIRAEIRPPNGCYDVQIDVQPRAIGLLLDGDRRWAVVARGSASLDWVLTQIRVVSRSIRGPYATGVAC